MKYVVVSNVVNEYVAKDGRKVSFNRLFIQLAGGEIVPINCRDMGIKKGDTIEPVINSFRGEPRLGVVKV